MDSDEESARVEDLLMDSTALHLVVCLGLESVAAVLLPQAKAAVSFASGLECLKRTPFHLACCLGKRSISILLLQYGASV